MVKTVEKFFGEKAMEKEVRVIPQSWEELFCSAATKRHHWINSLICK